jgi:peptidoglycan/LPS O-acetylase OafA/YrhL
MEIVAIIGAVSLGTCLAGTMVLLIMGEDTPKFIKIFTWISMIPLTICFSTLSAYVIENTECKVKYKKINIELYEKVN